MNKTKVTFIYDEQSQKWEVEVSGVETELEACQAFNAVVLTAHSAIPVTRYNKCQWIPEKNHYTISVGVML